MEFCHYHLCLCWRHQDLQLWRLHGCRFCMQGVLSCGVAYTLQILGQKNVNPAVASLILSLESCFSVLAGWIILGERLSFRESLGCILMFLAIILAQLPDKK
ncbi:MAG: EamA family transporter [Dorea longicatena]